MQQDEICLCAGSVVALWLHLPHVCQERPLSSSRIAARVQRIKPSPSSAAQDRANELRRQGRDIVNLVVGEPDFDTPEHIRRAACEAIERGETRYTMSAGTPALRQAVCNKLLRENGLSYLTLQAIARRALSIASSIAVATNFAAARGCTVISRLPDPAQ